MEIKKTKLLEDQMNLVIEYEEGGKSFGVIISVENIVKNFKVLQKIKEIGFELL